MRLQVLAIFLVTIVTGCHSQLTETEAKDSAVNEFTRVCDDFHYDRKLFNGPVLVKAGPPHFEYEWEKQPVDRSGGGRLPFPAHGQ